MKSIGVYAFYECTSLASVTIPGSVKSIGDIAFGWDIKDVYYDGTKEEWKQIEGISSIGLSLDTEIHGKDDTTWKYYE